jgi:hypothetical protein
MDRYPGPGATSRISPPSGRSSITCLACSLVPPLVLSGAGGVPAGDRTFHPDAPVSLVGACPHGLPPVMALVFGVAEPGCDLALTRSRVRGRSSRAHRIRAAPEQGSSRRSTGQGAPRAGREDIRHGRAAVLLLDEAVRKRRSRKRAARLLRCTSEPPCTTPSRRTACVRRARWPFSERTLTGDPAGSPGLFPTATDVSECDTGAQPAPAGASNSSRASAWLEPLWTPASVGQRTRSP